MTSPVTVLYIAGLGRSGSTLVERTLGTVDGFHPLGEVVHLWSRGLASEERCGCGEGVTACPFWSKVGQVAFAGWDRLDLGEVMALQRSVDRTRFVPLLTWPQLRVSFRSALERYASILGDVYAAAAEVSGANVLIDSSKHASTAYLLRHVPGIDLRVLHLVRDPRGVAHSWAKTVARPSAGAQATMARYSPLKTSVHYVAQNGLIDLLQFSSVPQLRLRYEDFVTEPVPSIGRVLELSGVAGRTLAHLDPGSIVLTANHIVGGNPMKFETGTVTLRRDDDWRAAMAPGRRRLVSALTAPLRLAYRYRGRR
jgi:hypothetical protein